MVRIEAKKKLANSFFMNELFQSQEAFTRKTEDDISKKKRIYKEKEEIGFIDLALGGCVPVHVAVGTTKD